MQPQTLPTPGYQAQPQPEPPVPASKKGRRGGVWIVIIVVVAALAIAGVWWWQQTKVDSLAHTNADLAAQLVTATNQRAGASDDSQTTTFGESKVPFTFAYPSNWILSSDATILYEKDLPVSYSITLSSPGTVNSQTPAGGSAVTAGALINIAVLPAATTNVKSLVPALPNATTPTPTTDVTVSGIGGVQYQFGETGRAHIFTDIIKDKSRYSITFEDNGALKSNPHYPAYEALIKSFKLK